jgi:gelsolin
MSKKIEAKQAKLSDSNVALIGSKGDLEQRIKAAKTEKEWEKAGQKVGVQVWRIEKFKVVPWPLQRHGEFHQGDSYIVLNTYKKDEKTEALSWNIHFWLGSESSQDEYGTAAYKTVELDDFLGGSPVEFRECQDYESHSFVKLFKNGIQILQGGVDSGFRHVEPKSFKPRLFHIKGKRGVVTEVDLECDSLNDGDTFILDNGDEVFLWVGQKSDINESWKGVAVAEEMVGCRKPKCHLTRLEQKKGTDNNDTFWKLLGGKKTIKPDAGDDMVNHAARKHELFQLSDRSGKCEFKKVAEGVLTYDLFKTDDVFIADVGDSVICWVGKGASNTEKAKAFEYSIRYLEAQKRPPFLPLIKLTQGNENPGFFHYIKKK